MSWSNSWALCAARTWADRTLYHRFACLVTFLKSAKHPVVALKDAPSYTETQIAMYTPEELL